jgi:hypothetical protein
VGASARRKILTALGALRGLRERHGLESKNVGDRVDVDPALEAFALLFELVSRALQTFLDPLGRGVRDVEGILQNRPNEVRNGDPEIVGESL